MENSSSLMFDEVNHIYTYNGKRIPSVSQILLDEGFIDNKFFTEEGRNRGSDVHTIIKHHCMGAHCMMKPSLAPYFSAFQNFEKDCDWKPEIIETMMACELYAGTPDQIGYFEGDLSVLDIKSGSISAATGLQLSGYEKLYNLNYNVDYNTTRYKPLKRFALQLKDTGRYVLTQYKDRGDRHIWDSAVSIWWFKQNMRR